MSMMSGSSVHKRGANSYFEWLVRKIGGNVPPYNKYIDVLWQLHSIDYRYSIPNDVNRISDGLKLRDLYIYERGVQDFGSWPCSVFEVLCGLARRISEDVLGDEEGSLMGKWFWRMVSNLGVLNKGLDRGRICSITESWISRSFEPDGGGSPFPLKHPDGDQRRAELWLQLCAYMNENPDMEEA